MAKRSKEEQEEERKKELLRTLRRGPDLDRFIDEKKRNFVSYGHDIYFRTSHVPCVDDTRSQLSKQIERKEKMLDADIEFQKEHQNDCAICSGDYNGAADEEDCYCRERFNDFIFKDLLSENTYEEQKLDHCYVSEGFSGKGITVNAEILDDYYMQFSDHKMISITLKAGEKNEDSH